MPGTTATRPAKPSCPPLPTCAAVQPTGLPAARRLGARSTLPKATCFPPSAACDSRKKSWAAVSASAGVEFDHVTIAKLVVAPNAQRCGAHQPANRVLELLANLVVDNVCQ